jgi:hypothetical protein
VLPLLYLVFGGGILLPPPPFSVLVLMQVLVLLLMPLVLVQLCVVLAPSATPSQPTPKTQPTTKPMHLDTFLARCKLQGSSERTLMPIARTYQTNHEHYTSRWKWGVRVCEWCVSTYHSTSHVTAAVVGFCVHGDNVRSCILRLFAFWRTRK